MLNERKKHISSIGPLKDGEDYINDHKRMSEILNTQFKNVFTEPKPQWIIKDVEEHFGTETLINDLSDVQLIDFHFSKEDVIEALSQINDKAAPGPDTWSAKFLKQCKTSISEPLWYL